MYTKDLNNRMKLKTCLTITVNDVFVIIVERQQQNGNNISCTFVKL